MSFYEDTRRALTFSTDWALGGEWSFFVWVQKVVPLALRNHTSFFFISIPPLLDISAHFLGSDICIFWFFPHHLLRLHPLPPSRHSSSLSFSLPPPPLLSPCSCSPKCEVMIVAMATKTSSQSGFVLIRPSLSPSPSLSLSPLSRHSPLSAWAKCNDNKWNNSNPPPHHHSCNLSHLKVSSSFPQWHHYHHHHCCCCCLLLLLLLGTMVSGPFTLDLDNLIQLWGVQCTHTAAASSGEFYPNIISDMHTRYSAGSEPSDLKPSPPVIDLQRSQSKTRICNKDYLLG